MTVAELIERLEEISLELDGGRNPKNILVVTKNDFGRLHDIDEVEVIEIDKKSYVLLI